MTLTQLNILKTVVETESFTKTADALHITQSGVSHSIASLEDELEIKLVKSNKRSVSLTEAGEKIYILAKDILSRIDRSKEEISALKNLQTGKLKLGCFQSVSVRILPGILKVFKQKYPGIEVSWFEGTDLEVKDWIINEAVDIGFVVSPSIPISLPARLPSQAYGRDANKDGLETIPLLEDKMLGVFPAKHPLCSKKHINIKELAGEHLITFKGSSCGMLVTSNLINAINNLGEIKKIEARNISTVIEMVRGGIGVAIMPELAVPQNYAGICLVPLKPEVKREIALAYRSSSSLDSLSLSAKAFIEITRKWIEEHFKIGGDVS